MDEQNADLNQPSGIFGEEKKGFFENFKKGMRDFFAKLSSVISKIFVKKTIEEDSDFVGPMDRNIFTDEKEASNLVRHEATMDEISGEETAASDEPEKKNEAEFGPIHNMAEHSVMNNHGGEDKKNNYKTSGQLPEIFYPETPEDLVWLIKKLPEDVLTKEQKQTIGAAMSFDAKLVKEVMTPKEEVIIIHENDFMGPLTLSRLYKSGLTHFPVVGSRGEIVGWIHTRTLFSLSVKETDRASAFLDKNVYYMSENYTLKEALAAFARTSCHFFVVVDDHGRVTGVMSFKKLISMIAGELPETDFDQDQDLMSVVKHAREITGTHA